MGSLKKIILAEPNMIFFFKDPHVFPYYPSKCLHNEFILPMILPVYMYMYHKKDIISWIHRLELYDVTM